MLPAKQALSVGKLITTTALPLISLNGGYGIHDNNLLGIVLDVMLERRISRFSSHKTPSMESIPLSIYRDAISRLKYPQRTWLIIGEIYLRPVNHPLPNPSRRSPFKSPLMMLNRSSPCKVDFK